MRSSASPCVASFGLDWSVMVGLPSRTVAIVSGRSSRVGVSPVGRSAPYSHGSPPNGLALVLFTSESLFY